MDDRIKIVLGFPENRDQFAPTSKTCPYCNEEYKVSDEEHDAICKISPKDDLVVESYSKMPVHEMILRIILNPDQNYKTTDEKVRLINRAVLRRVYKVKT